MPFTVSTVEAANPRGLTAAAGELGLRISELDAVIDDQRSAVHRLRAAWRGDGADAQIAVAERHLDEQVRVRSRLESVRESLTAGGAQLAAARDGLLGVVGTLRDLGWTVTEGGRAFAPRVPGLLQQFEPGFTYVITRLLRLFDEIDADAADRVGAAVSGS